MKYDKKIYNPINNGPSFKLLHVLLILLHISIILCDNNNYVFFPLKKIDNSAIKNMKNITEIMKFLYLEPLMSELYIGTPEQKVNIIFRVDCTYLYLTSYSHKASKNDQASEFIKLKYGDLNYFNEEKSQSINYNEKVFNFSYAYDNQFCSKCISENVKINNNNIKIDLSLSNYIELEEPGAICLQLEEKTSSIQFSSSFPILLKKNYSLINDYKWFIYFGQNNETDYLVIGSSPNEFICPDTGKKIYPNFDIDKDYYTVDDEIIIRKAGMTINFNDIYLLSDAKEKEYFEDEKSLKGKLIPNIRFIVGTKNYSIYVQNNIFGKFISSNQCHKGIFNQRPNLVGEEYIYYYCDETVYDNIRSVFKKIIFKQASLSELFELTFDDLFLKQNGYLIFLVIFSTHEHRNWDLGTIFLKKYQFDFDFDKKKIGYYHVKIIDNKKEGDDVNRTDNEGDDVKRTDNKNKGNDEKENNTWVYVLFSFSILILSGVLIILGIYLGKNYFKLRKKRANELDDDAFEYKAKNNQDSPILSE